MMHVGGWIHKDGSLMTRIELFGMISIELDELQANALSQALNTCIENGRKLDDYKPPEERAIVLVDLYGTDGEVTGQTTLNPNPPTE